MLGWSFFAGRSSDQERKLLILMASVCGACSVLCARAGSQESRSSLLCREKEDFKPPHHVPDELLCWNESPDEFAGYQHPAVHVIIAHFRASCPLPARNLSFLKVPQEPAPSCVLGEMGSATRTTTTSPPTRTSEQRSSSPGRLGTACSAAPEAAF